MPSKKRYKRPIPAKDLEAVQQLESTVQAVKEEKNPPRPEKVELSLEQQVILYHQSHAVNYTQIADKFKISPMDVMAIIEGSVHPDILKNYNATLEKTKADKGLAKQVREHYLATQENYYAIAQRFNLTVEAVIEILGTGDDNLL